MSFFLQTFLFLMWTMCCLHVAVILHYTQVNLVGTKDKEAYDVKIQNFVFFTLVQKEKSKRSQKRAREEYIKKY